MAIPFEQVYRMRTEGDPYWSIVMGLTPLPGRTGLWMYRADPTHPELSYRGQVFEGDDGKLVLVGTDGRHMFEPLTIERWEEMRDSIGAFDEIRKSISTDAFLQSWYWDEFANDGAGNELTQAEVMERLAAREQMNKRPIV